MLLAATIAVFLLMLTAVGGAGYWLYVREGGAIPTLARPPAKPNISPNAPEWGAWLAKLGAGSPWRPEVDRASLRRRLIAAGLRWDGAIYAYMGGRVICPVAAVGLVFLYALVSGDFAGAFGFGPLAVYLGYTFPDRYLRRMAAKRRSEINRSLPDFLDLLVIAIESGLSMDQALVDTARDLRKAHPTLADELFVFGRETRAGVTRSEGLRNLGARTGEPEMRKLCQMLVQADRFGSSISKVLRTQARYMRTRRRQRAEEKAHKTSIKLLFPIFFLIMPSVFLVTAGPAVIMLLTNFSKLAGE